MDGAIAVATLAKAVHGMRRLPLRCVSWINDCSYTLTWLSAPLGRRATTTEPRQCPSGRGPFSPATRISRDEATSSSNVERTVLAENSRDRVGMNHVHCHGDERVAPAMPTIGPGGHDPLVR